jgi:hypothetical protein
LPETIVQSSVRAVVVIVVVLALVVEAAVVAVVVVVSVDRTQILPLELTNMSCLSAVDLIQGAPQSVCAKDVAP